MVLVSCPARMHLLAKNGLVKTNFSGLFPKSAKDQCDWEIGNYYIALSVQQKYFFHVYLSIHTFLEQVWCKML